MRTDFDYLSEKILAKTHETVSSNTLMRLWGYRESVNARRSTLDILARFVGSEDYAHFLRERGLADDEDLPQPSREGREYQPDSLSQGSQDSQSFQNTQSNRNTRSTLITPIRADDLCPYCKANDIPPTKRVSARDSSFMGSLKSSRVLGSTV